MDCSDEAAPPRRADESRRRSSERTGRGDATATTRCRRGERTGRGDAAATTRIFRGRVVAATPRIIRWRDVSRRRHYDIDIQRRDFRGDAAATTRIFSGRVGANFFSRSRPAPVSRPRRRRDASRSAAASPRRTKRPPPRGGATPALAPSSRRVVDAPLRPLAEQLLPEGAALVAAALVELDRRDDAPRLLAHGEGLGLPLMVVSAGGGRGFVGRSASQPSARTSAARRGQPSRSIGERRCAGRVPREKRV